MRLLCVDFGDQRTGLATGDMITGLVSPAGVLEIPVRIEGGAALIRACAAAAREHDARALVVGLPLNMDDSEGPRARLVRGLAQRLCDATGLEVHLQDERLSSVQADWTMQRSGLSRGQKKSRRDALAAATILGDFFARQRTQATRQEPNDDRPA
ncbi:MAG: Holliday junction resolvase RuvX [Phycisphaerales bacterium]